MYLRRYGYVLYATRMELVLVTGDPRVLKGFTMHRAVQCV